MRGSAVCTRKREVYALDLETNQGVTATQTQCELTLHQGLLNVVGLLGCLIMMVCFWRLLDGKIVDMDAGTKKATSNGVHRAIL